jgi:phosphoribosylformylglycinamidine synthase
MRKTLVASCHDLSDGGFGVALAESAFSGGFGASVDLAALGPQRLQRDDVALFSESLSRFLITVTPENRAAFEEAMSGFDLYLVGEVSSGPKLLICGLDGSMVVDADVLDLKKAWQEPLGV